MLLKDDGIRIDRAELVTDVKEKIPKEMDSVTKAYFNVAPLTPYSEIPKELKDKFTFYHAISRAYLEVADLIECSQRERAHLALSAPIDRHELNKETMKLAGQEDLETMAAIVFQSLTWVEPRSYEEYLKLSEHRHIRDFRDMFFGTYDDLVDGKSSLDNVQARLKKTKEVINRLDAAKRVSDILFWVSLPLEVLTIFGTGVPGIGLALAAPTLYGYVQRWRYKWALPDICSPT